PTPERAVARTQRRMPGIEDFPIPAQNELRVMRGDAPGQDHPEKRRMGLLQRLASVGLGGGRREDEPETANQRSAASRAPIRPQNLPPRPLTPPRQPEAVSEYAKRPVHQGLDPLGRQTTVHNGEEDQLDIPAFLRRQAN